MASKNDCCRFALLVGICAWALGCTSTAGSSAPAPSSPKVVAATNSVNPTPSTGAPEPARARKVKLLAFNDFHGQLESGLSYEHRPVGGAAVLGAYLRNAMKGVENESLVLVAGDHIGASPPVSGLLQDEPSILFLNQIANQFAWDHARMMPGATWWPRSATTNSTKESPNCAE